MYNKIFTKILDSSIWLENDTTRLVWLTMIACMDEEGFVQFASIKNLAYRTRVSEESAVEAVKVLESPDINSSDPENEGRRIERVPGGWMVLNSKKYREIVTRSVSMEKTRRRVAEFRERQKQGFPDKMSDQKGLCDCCHKEFEAPFSLYVVQDHCHLTGKNRGLVCQSCNKIVGLIENGKQVLSEKKEDCLRYIEKWKCNAYVTPPNESVTPSEAVSASAAIAPKQVKPGRAKALPDEEWLKALESDPAYEGIPVLMEVARCRLWCANRAKSFSRSRVLSWLNRIERPLKAEGQLNLSPGGNAPIVPIMR